ncbi:MAG: alpha/beta hydrolase, partial [Brevibacterium aurantiacum]
DCSPRWREGLGDLRVPSLVVHGRADPFFPVGNGQALAAAIPAAQLLTYEDMGTQIPEWATDGIATAMLRL